MAADLRFDVSALDKNAGKVFNKLATVIDRLERQLDKLDGKSVNAEIGVETGKAEREVGKFATDTRRKLEAALTALPELEITADSSDLDRDLDRVRREMAELADKRIGVDLSAADAIAEAKRLQRELDEIGRRSPDIQVQADTAAASAHLAAVTAEADRLDGRNVRVKVDVDKSLSDSIIKVALLGKALGSLAVPAAAVAAAPQIASIGAAAFTASGSLWLLPAAATSAGFAFAALKIATQGFGDAVSASDPAKLAEAMKDLAPSARQSVTAIRGLSDAFTDMRLDVQQRLFDGFGPIISRLGNTYLPILSERFGRIADAANQAGRDIGTMLLSAGRIADIKSIGSSAATVFENLSAAVKPLVGAFVDIAAVGGKVLVELTEGAGAAAQRFADFIAQARLSGELEQWIRQGVTALEQLGSIAGNVGGILGGIFKAAQSSGSDFLGTVDKITAGIREFVNSAQGQTAIADVFRTIRETVDAATPGVKALATAVTDVINKISDSGIGPKIGAAFSAIAQSVGPAASALGGLAVNVLGPLLSALQTIAPIAGPAAAALLGVWAAAKVMTGISAISTAVGGFTTKLSALGTAAGGGVRGAIAGLAGALGAGGVLGVALGVAGAALGIWAGAQASAAQAVANHQAAVDNLAGTLDKFSGSATQATAAFQANEIATRKLSDGTTTLGDALRTAGISSADFVAATTGNQAKLEQINGTLHSQAEGLLQNSDLWQKNKWRFDEAGVSLDLLTDAALGNVQAQDQMQQKLGATNGGMEDWKKRLGEVVGPLGEIGSALGDMSGKFAEAQKQTKEAAAASKDFTQVLDSMKAGLAGLKDNKPPTELMAAGFRELGTSAAAAAQKVGENAKAWGGVTEGANKAEESMKGSRQAFLDAAAAAGIAAPQAEALANQIGLIPAAARVIFETNATGVAAEMITLGFQVAAVPGAKQITVSALSQEAEKKISDLGFKVTHMENGQVTIDVRDEAGRAKLETFLAFTSGRVAIIKIDANPDPATGKISATVDLGNGKTAVMKLDANPDPATGKINGTVELGNGQTATITLEGNPDPVTGKIVATVDFGNGQVSTILLNPNDLVTPAIRGIPRTGETVWTIRVVRQEVTIPGAGNANLGSGSGTIGRAGGGITGYSGGGIRARRGMVLPGYAPGRDTELAMLSRGEAVLVPELVRTLGARRILAANAEASGGRPATVTGRIASIMDGMVSTDRPSGRGAPLHGGYRPNDTNWRPPIHQTGAGGASSAALAAVHGELQGLRADLRRGIGDMAAEQHATSSYTALGTRYTRDVADELRRRRPSAASDAQDSRTLGSLGGW